MSTGSPNRIRMRRWGFAGNEKLQESSSKRKDEIIKIVLRALRLASPRLASRKNRDLSNKKFHEAKKADLAKLVTGDYQKLQEAKISIKNELESNSESPSKLTS